MRTGVRFPARSSSSPASVWGPSSKVEAKVTVAPATSGAGAARPSMVASTAARFSSATRVSESATATSSPSAGVEETSAGAVLSTMTVRSEEFPGFPALSVARARRSYLSSATLLVFQLVPFVVQVPAPAGEPWTIRVATPEPAPSLAEGLSETVPRSGEPGSARETFGAVASIVQEAPAGVASVLAELSVARTSKVCPPSPRPVYAAGHAANGDPSREHSNVLPDSSEVNAKLASRLAEREAGPDVMIVSGGSVSASLFTAVQSNWTLTAEPWKAFSAPAPVSGNETRNSYTREAPAASVPSVTVVKASILPL